jgi:hypothetical protein
MVTIAMPAVRFPFDTLIANLRAAGAVTGVWWLLLGTLVMLGGEALRRALGPARWAVPPQSSRTLLIAGAVVTAVSLLGGLL